jgi:hypothetical protein
MKAKVREYQAGAKRCEERARKVRDPRTREWQMILARSYRMLAEAEIEVASRPRSAA